LELQEEFLGCLDDCPFTEASNLFDGFTLLEYIDSIPEVCYVSPSFFSMMRTTSRHLLSFEGALEMKRRGLKAYLEGYKIIVKGKIPHNTAFVCGEGFFENGKLDPLKIVKMSFKQTENNDFDTGVNLQ